MRFIDDNPRLTIAGAVGLVLFAALFHRAFMGGVRPEPLSRDEVVQRGLAFAAEEGWTSANRISWALPVEGDDAREVRAASPGAAVDRESLPDPTWEAWIVTDSQTVRAALPNMTWPSPLLSLALTPDGRVVQYVETSSPIAGQPLAQFNPQRRSPLAPPSTARRRIGNTSS